jgi:hypothetical protein
VPENIRLDALNALATLAIADPAFASDLFTDLDTTLPRYGFSLTEQELEVVREFQSRVQDSDVGVDGLLRNPRTVYGFWRHHEVLLN